MLARKLTRLSKAINFCSSALIWPGGVGRHTKKQKKKEKKINFSTPPPPPPVRLIRLQCKASRQRCKKARKCAAGKAHCCCFRPVLLIGPTDWAPARANSRVVPPRWLSLVLGTSNSRNSHFFRSFVLLALLLDRRAQQEAGGRRKQREEGRIFRLFKQATGRPAARCCCCCCRRSCANYSSLASPLDRWRAQSGRARLNNKAEQL